MNRDVFKKIHLASRRLESCKKVAGRVQDADRHFPGRCRQRRRDGRAAQQGQARPRHQHGAALPGSADHGCLPRGGRALHGHGQLRAARRSQVHVQMAVALSRQVQGQGHDGGPRLRLRSGRQSNIYCAYAQENLFDEIDTIDIIDCNDGSHGKAFATNFNPEINLREVTQRGKYWKDGKWIDIDPLSISAMIDYPEVGPRKILPHLSRGGGEPRREHQGPEADPLLDDVLRQLHQAPRRAAERRHDAHRSRHVQGHTRSSRWSS